MHARLIQPRLFSSLLFATLGLAAVPRLAGAQPAPSYVPLPSQVPRSAAVARPHIDPTPSPRIVVPPVAAPPPPVPSLTPAPPQATITAPPPPPDVPSVHPR